MHRMNIPGLLTQAVSSLRTIRTRTWLILGAIVLVITGLIVWAGIALLSWMWAQAPAATEMGKRAVTEGATRIEQVAPDLKAQAKRWLPGVKEQVDRWVPGLGDEPPARDVSGADPGPVPRFPGLVRSRFVRDEKMIEATYVGRADFDAVLTHYVQGFAAGGFTQEVLAAAAEEERHQFVGASGRFEVRIGRRPGGVVEVDVRQILQ